MGVRTCSQSLSYFIKVKSHEYGDDLIKTDKLKEALEEVLKDFAKHFQEKYLQESCNHTSIEIKLLDNSTSSGVQH